MGGKHVRPMIANDRASNALGMRVERDEPGLAVVGMAIRDDMLNGFGIVHGGFIFALADTAFAIACNELDSDRVTVAAGADIAFLKQVLPGDTLTATARRVAGNGRTGLYDVTLTDQAGDVVAEFRGRSRTTDQTRSWS
ncbi:hydroxyphenylacetyl-CoA thioesterase PaaI [Agromyces sp. MMS24-K17]|uniref:hydroxyphenylacetyl-CoA thioesterase PaaI n=1 Tax=Agromyces sp. MMS24-K17 TaxID=3372850 RepID=UPI003754E9EA